MKLPSVSIRTVYGVEKEIKNAIPQSRLSTCWWAFSTTFDCFLATLATDAHEL